MSNQTEGSPIPGVYALICTATGDKYVGSSKNILNRFRDHFRRLEQRNHENVRIQRLFDQFGRKGFRVGFIEEVENENLRYHAEQRHMDSGDYSLNINLHVRSKHLLGCITPWGRFSSAKKAASQCPAIMVSEKWVLDACKLSYKVIDSDAYHRSSYLKTFFDDDVIGQTYRSIGFEAVYPA